MMVYGALNTHLSSVSTPCTTIGFLEAGTIRPCLCPWEDGIHQLTASYSQYGQQSITNLRHLLVTIGVLAKFSLRHDCLDSIPGAKHRSLLRLHLSCSKPYNLCQRCICRSPVVASLARAWSHAHPECILWRLSLHRRHFQISQSFR